MDVKGLIIAAPASGSGKTVVTLALLRALVQRGGIVGSVKIGPDYIDPAYHSIATGRPCRTLDLWGMRPDTCRTEIAKAGEGAEVVIGEGVMGLFDGASTTRNNGQGSTADVAAWTGWPVILVIDVKGQGESAAAIVEGFINHRPDIAIAGILFNRVGGPRHASILERAMEAVAAPVLGCIPRHRDLVLASRHLGLIQANEKREIGEWIDRAAKVIADHVDVSAVIELAQVANAAEADVGGGGGGGGGGAPLPVLGNHIAIARDDAFSFCYPHVVEGWRDEGCTLSFFSPLQDEAPKEIADAVYLPGGYPELHAGKLAANETFLSGLRSAAARGAKIFGECGGFMVLGEGLIDKDGHGHRMAGLLPVETSFAEPRLHLGYRQLSLAGDCILGGKNAAYRGHEFHYASLVKMSGKPLFEVQDARDEALPTAGVRSGTVAGSFIHLIDRV